MRLLTSIAIVLIIALAFVWSLALHPGRPLPVQQTATGSRIEITLPNLSELPENVRVRDCVFVTKGGELYVMLDQPPIRCNATVWRHAGRWYAKIDELSSTSVWEDTLDLGRMAPVTAVGPVRWEDRR